jgi:hypothetical protein
MNKLFAVGETAKWYTFKEYETFVDLEGYERIRPKNRSRRIAFNPFEYGENERTTGEVGENLILKFAAIGQNIEDKEKAREKVLEFVHAYGLLGFYRYWLLYSLGDKKLVFPKQERRIIELPTMMDASCYQALFFDHEYSISEVNSWPDNTYIWYRYSERIDWIIAKAHILWRHVQAADDLNKAVQSKKYINNEVDTDKNQHAYYIDFLDKMLPALRYSAANVSLGLEYNSEKEELEISWGMSSLLSFLEIIHIKNCTEKKTIGVCKVCGSPYLIASPLKNSGCCREVCRHRFNARKSKAYRDLEKKHPVLGQDEYEFKYKKLIEKYGEVKNPSNPI